ncbi:MAG: thioredoxin domain-containing protein [Desulfocapsaceae bacterium]|jgi:thioredoxin 2|nr:thioredoxin domain-containing protein [Desulfocapsaceae bacterium]
MNAVIASCPECGAKNRIPEKKQHQGPLCGRCGRRISLGTATVPVNLGDGDFQQFIKHAELPVMVDFFAPTCGPCQAIAPLVSRLAGRYAGQMIVAKLDTSKHPGTAAHYQIRGVPSLLFFRNGIVVDQLVGAPPEPELVSRIETIITSS